MKIVMINGQNHKGSTYNIGRLLANKIGSDKDIVEFFLPKDLNHFCLGCYTCIEDDTKCPFYEEKNRIMKEVEEADILIFTTPTYCLRASAPMKNFIDLTFNYWMSHRPRKCMFNKKAVVISTAAGSGAKKAVKDVSDALFYWGIPCIVEYGICIQAMNWDGVSKKKKQKIEKDTIRIAQRLSRKKRVKAGIKTKAMFSLMRMMQKADLGSGEADKSYWEKSGWLGKERPWRMK
ncbi:NADPH-dependent oxidoreductase [Butyrivibrio sp. X503]|uniref:flavodoxin family protein n=1 Tax=Butyrivibrio sp. X503 TaxID=2364878 RepID=UPI000EAA3B41|nr:NAD(P)H-dependent oxidoreductase [Butyrivibrio sp. X503]RKM56257.1 NADPH-dependent oxidoreductase [Butyrivibrio sp. X503]